MFLLDNQVVRTDWARAKAAVTDTLAKYGAEVVSARRWDERKLAYPIRGRKRGTFLLAYYRSPVDVLQPMRRDLELDERVLRYLILGVEVVPEGEVEKSQAELQSGFSVPPPQDDEPAWERAAPAHEPAREAEGAAEAAEEIAVPEEVTAGAEEES